MGSHNVETIISGIQIRLGFLFRPHNRCKARQVKNNWIRTHPIEQNSPEF